VIAPADNPASRVSDTAQTSNSTIPYNEPAPTSSSTTEAISTLQQTVSLLISERTELQAKLAESVSQLDSSRGNARLLDEGRSFASKLEFEKGALERKITDLEAAVKDMEGLRTDLSSSHDEVERLTQDLITVQRERDESQASQAELKERAEEKTAELETNLGRARERESGLEAELGRLRQVSRPRHLRGS
jgi:chromosome segregation ATPase